MCCKLGGWSVRDAVGFTKSTKNSSCFCRGFMLSLDVDIWESVDLYITCGSAVRDLFSLEDPRWMAKGSKDESRLSLAWHLA